MGDKDLNELLGIPELFLCGTNGEMKPLGKVIENSVRFAPEDAAELDRLSVREKTTHTPFKVECISLNGSIIFDEPNVDIDSLLGIDLASESSDQTCSLVIQSEPKINKPKNLKYPNKKRARRIWKKWKRRFGGIPSKSIYLPKVKIESRIANEKNGYLRYDVTAEPIKPIMK